MLKFTLHTLHSNFTLNILQSALRSPHFTPTVCTLRLESVRFRALHFTLHIRPHNFALFTLDTVWNLGTARLSFYVRTSTSRPALSPHRVTSCHAPKGPLRCWRWTWNFPLHSALCSAHFTHSTLHTSMFFPLYTPHSTLYTHTLHVALQTLLLHVALTLQATFVFHAHHVAIYVCCIWYSVSHFFLGRWFPFHNRFVGSNLQPFIVLLGV